MNAPEVDGAAGALQIMGSVTLQSALTVHACVASDSARTVLVGDGSWRQLTLRVELKLRVKSGI